MTDSKKLNTSPIAIHPFVPATATEAEWQEYHGYCRLRTAEDWPDRPQQTDAARRRDILKEWPLGEQLEWLAFAGGRIVGNIWMSRRRPGTPDYELHAPFTWAGGGVRHDSRRQGIATHLLGTLAGFMQQNGQTTASLSAGFPAGHTFLSSAGAIEKQRMIENRLAISAVNWDELAHWEQAAARVQPALTWEIYPARIPLERFEALAPSMTALFNAQPFGTLELPPIRYNLSTLAAWYDEMDANGGNNFFVSLHHGDELVAMCDASYNAQVPDRAHQALTAVARGWRGKGLAKAVKARMMRLMRETRPGIELVITANATVNAAMLAVNNQLGFVKHKDVRTYQISREGLEAAVAKT